MLHFYCFVECHNAECWIFINMLSVRMLSVALLLLCWMPECWELNYCCYAECQNAKCCIFIVMPNVRMLSVAFFIVMLRVIMLNGISSVSWHLSDTSRVVLYICREFWRGKYHCTIDLLFDWFGISCMTTDNFCFYLQNGLIQTSQTGGQW